MRTVEWRVDPHQWEAAVADCDGPQLLVAGPGTGKTEFLVRRAFHLIDARGVAPDELAVLAFSRRGAARLRDRIVERLDRSYTVVPASTFHSLCHRLLETYGAEAFGWRDPPVLLTGPEQLELVGELLAVEAPEAWPAALRDLLHTRTLAEEVTDFLLRSQERLLGPEELAQLAEGRDDWRALPSFLSTYQAELAKRGRIDYGTLQARAVQLLDHPEVGPKAGRQRYLLVDEYQDTTPAQAALLEGLYLPHRNLTVAADP